MSLRALPGIGIGLGFTTAANYHRTRALAATDDLYFGMFLDGRGYASQRGRQIAMTAGDAVLLSGAEIGATHHPDEMRYLSLSLERSKLAALVPNIEDLCARSIDASNEAVRLLIRYSELLQRGPMARDLAATLAPTHLYDLVAAALGATRDAAETARGHGLRVARMAAVKDEIARNIASPRLNVDALAKQLGISPRYVRKLFEGEGTSYSDWVLSQRLALAHRLLVGDRLQSRPIAEIALKSGFGDISYFNRSFRRRYGMTPSDARNQGLLHP